MSKSQRSAGGVTSAARGVLLALLAAAALAGFLCLIVGVGMLRITRDQAAADTRGGDSVAQPSSRPDESRADEPSTDGEESTKTGPATRTASHPLAAAPPDAPVLEAPPTVVPAAPAVIQRAGASLVAVDDTSRGGWVGRYGKQGYFVAMAGSTPHLPPGVEATLYLSHPYTWSSPTTDPRGLSIPEMPSRFSAGQWFAWDRFSLDLDLRKGPEPGYQVALYLLDWDSDSRVQRLDAVDAETGATLLTRTDAHFHNGRYVVLRLAGHVTLRFTRTGGANCTLSGVFLDDAAAKNR